MTVSSAANAPSPFPMGDRLFPDSYFGETAPVEHHLPIFSGGDGPSFKDVIDTINPLQHLPVVSAIYREITGDEPGAASRLVGAGLYGGPIGFVGELINCAIDDNTGKDIGGHAIAFLEDQFSEPGSDTPTAIANTSTTAPAIASSANATPAPAAPEPPAPAAAPQAQVARADLNAPPAPMILGANGLQPVTLARAATAPTAPNGASGPMAAAALTPPPIAGMIPDSRLHPVPARRSFDAVQAPQVHVPISQSSQRSNVPITGQYNPPMTSASAQQGMIQANATAPTTGGDVATLPPGAATTGNSQQWFSSAMMQALDKYQRSGQLGQPQNLIPQAQN